MGPDGRAPLTDYYNLKGQMVKRVGDGKTDKEMVLTTSKKEAEVDKAIDNGHIVNQITDGQVKQMDDIYAFGQSDKTGVGKGFLFGENGQSSRTVTGVFFTTHFTVNLPKHIVSWRQLGNKFYYEYDSKQIIYIYIAYKNEGTESDNWMLKSIDEENDIMYLGDYWKKREYDTGNLGKRKKVE